MSGFVKFVPNLKEKFCPAVEINLFSATKALIADVEVGQTYRGKVSKIVEFGAFINLLPGKDGLLHISQICAERSQKVEDVLREGQEIEVFVAGVDKQGRVKLEWKDKPGSATVVPASPETTSSDEE